MEPWESDDCIKKSDINSKNNCSGRELAVGAYIGGSIIVGEHRKNLVLQLSAFLTYFKVHNFEREKEAILIFVAMFLNLCLMVGI
ncbi:hypothetical protein P3S68_019085 [Capsicum galapagoense]